MTDSSSSSLSSSSSSSSVSFPSSSSSLSPSASIPRTLLSGALVGSLFGMALEKSKVFHPAVIRSQMTLGSFVMMKTFLSATATGLIVIALLEMMGYATRVNRSISLGVSGDRYGGNVLGGLILGVGLSLAGACPGTVFAQVGSGLPSALITLAGAFTGGLIFAEVHTRGTKSSPEILKISRSPSLDQLLKSDYLKTALLFSSAFALLVFGLEQVFPWKAELVGLFGSSIGPLSSSWLPSLSAKAWAPEIAGICIGLLQIPSYLLAEVPLGTSASYISMIHLLGKLIYPSLSDRHPVVKSHNTVKDLYQIGMVAGIAMGARMSQVASGVALEVVANSSTSLLLNLTPATSFLGGLLLILGARVAGGCTSGHGISGMARLSISSFFTTAAMFAGAMGYGLLFLK